MRKQTKIVALAAVLALGASFTSMAATYDWRMEDDGWYCYDEDAEPYDEEWVESYGYDYWVDEDGKLVTSSWVEDGEKVYYVNSEGKKTTSDWKYTYAMDEEDDDDAEEAWFYFDSKGVLQTDKKISWKGDTYYVDKDGKMVTGWIEYVKGNTNGNDVEVLDKETDVVTNVIYVTEDGTRAANEWYYGYKAGVDAEEDNVEEDEQIYYWINKDGKITTGKKTSINGETYFFGTNGVMLSGWVEKVAGKENTYRELKSSMTKDTEAYFCGNKDQGWMKKDRWIKVADASVYADADEDTTTYWFFINKNGKVFVPTNASASVTANKVTFKNGEARQFVATDANTVGELKKIDDDTFFFGADGKMLSGLYEIDEEMFYFGGSDEGQRKEGSFMIKDSYEDEYEVTFAKKASKATKSNAEGKAVAEYNRYAAYNGNVGGYLYEDGMIVKSSEKGVYADVTVEVLGDNCEFLVNYKGKVQTDDDDKYTLEDGSEFTFSKNAKFNNVENSLKEGAILTK